MNKKSYNEGVVIIKCDGCQNNHLIADNLGWFREDSSVNIEDLMREKKDELKKLDSADLLNIEDANLLKDL